MKALSVPLLKRCSPSVPNRWMLPSFHNIEQAALLCKDFSQKQQFLNTVYEQFFQGFSVEVADTHGIVYTPQPIVDFMVKSVAHILETEFDRSLSDTGVYIIDPFVGLATSSSDSCRISKRLHSKRSTAVNCIATRFYYCLTILRV